VGDPIVVEHVLDDLAGDGDGIREGWESVLARLSAYAAGS
jgi:hypothetical protein